MSPKFFFIAAYTEKKITNFFRLSSVCQYTVYLIATENIIIICLHYLLYEMLTLNRLYMYIYFKTGRGVQCVVSLFLILFFTSKFTINLTSAPNNISLVLFHSLGHQPHPTYMYIQTLYRHPPPPKHTHTNTHVHTHTTHAECKASNKIFK